MVPGMSIRSNHTTKFQQAVLTAVRLVPKGKVVSYGQVAAYIGAPRAARQVGWAMRGLEGAPDFPWWRVVNNAGRISIKGNQYNSAHQQREHLLAEGVTIHSDFSLNIEAYRFRPKPSTLGGLALNAEYVASIARYLGTD